MKATSPRKDGKGPAHRRNHAEETENPLAFQVSQAFRGILDFRNSRVGVFPEVEEFLVMGSCLIFLSFLLIQFGQTVMIQGMNEAAVLALRMHISPLRMS